MLQLQTAASVALNLRLLVHGTLRKLLLCRPNATEAAMISVGVDESIIDCFTWALWHGGKLAKCACYSHFHAHARYQGLTGLACCSQPSEKP